MHRDECQCLPACPSSSPPGQPSPSVSPSPRLHMLTRGLHMHVHVVSTCRILAAKEAKAKRASGHSPSSNNPEQLVTVAHTVRIPATPMLHITFQHTPPTYSLYNLQLTYLLYVVLGQTTL